MAVKGSHLKNQPKNLTAALAYAKRGWQVFAIRPRSKTPLTLHGFHDATSDPEVICKWWAKSPACGVGIATGRKSGVLVLDIDPRNNGDDTLEALILQYGDLPTTVEARTGGGGRHLFFALPEHQIIPSVKGLWPGIDIKSEGGYVVAPFSVHPSGFEYTWTIDQGPSLPQEAGGLEPADAPDWLLEALLEKRKQRSEAIREKHPDPDPFAEGNRNDALTSLAGTMRRRNMSQAAILAALLAENETRCSPPLTDEEVALIVESVCKYEADPDASPRTISKEAQDGSLIKWADVIKMVSEEERAPQWILEGWLARNDCAIIFGPPEVGKSWITLDLLVTAATGRPTLGHFTHNGEQFKVLLVDEENPVDEVWRRIHRIAKAWEVDPKELYNQIFVTQPCQGFTFSNDSYTYAIQKEVDRLRPDIIIFDSMTAISGIRKEADATEVRAFFHDKLYPLRSINNSSILVVHHSNKGIYQFDQQVEDAGLIRGSIDFAAASDAVFMVKPTAVAGTIILKPTKIRRGKKPDPLKVRIIDGEKGGTRPIVCGELRADAEDSLNKKLKDAIINLLRDQQTLSRDKLMEWSSILVPGTKEPNFKKAIRELLVEGALLNPEKSEDSRKSLYSLSPAYR